MLVEPSFAVATGLPPGLPMLHWRDGTVCEPVLAYFAWSAERRRVAISTMRGEAHAIREWLAFCAVGKFDWQQPSDASLSAWRDSMKADGALTSEASRIERKVRQVFGFYLLLPTAMPFGVDGAPTPAFVLMGGGVPGRRPVLTYREVKGKRVWSRAVAEARISFPRPTPSASEVAEVLTRLRTGAGRSRNVKDGEEMRLLSAERNWLMGRCMAEAGLRAQEVADLTMAAVFEMLARAKLVERAGGMRGPSRLDALPADEAAWSRLMSSIRGLEREHRTALRIRITGKGGKSRLAAFPLDLVRDILEIGVRSVRAWQLRRWSAIDAGFTPPPMVFLSMKTKRNFTAGAIGDVMKDAFTAEPAIHGSGHRLRAFYAVTTAIRIFGECMVSHGHVLTRATVEMALKSISEALGHSEISTTVRFYLDIAMLAYSRPGDLEGPWRELAGIGADLSPARSALLRHVVTALAASDDRSLLCGVLKAACDRTDLRAVATTKA